MDLINWLNNELSLLLESEVGLEYAQSVLFDLVILKFIKCISIYYNIIISL
jgi:hypothetical protein